MSKKLIWGIIILAVIGIGMWLFFRNKENAPSEKPLADKVVGVEYVGNDVHTIEGTLTLPNPCYTLSVATEKRSGSPEKVLIRFTAKQTADVCAQVLYEASFRTTFNAADNAVLSAQINEVPLPLELTRRERVSAQEDGDFLLKQGEDRWVEDLHVMFIGVEDDSRCPVDVTCIQAGWITLRFKADAEEIQLRLPGDTSVPNAAVVGSYVITLVNVEPAPKSNEPQENRAYTATLRVEIHDIKG